ncbi:helix-turn-helix transcriptional regulator [Collinsella tanakaei]|uniref:helix-turn-helix domain-containing protein n=1 Tax=Collinsella tanakaei TaxID=626935 RepID=UPI002943B08E|nr:helix-turn-helix transcriptional regulator [Collinsella tanakaei]
MNEFGKYLREIRASRRPSISQEALGNAVGRSKMTICQFEQGKTAPPRGELLDAIIDALEATKDEEQELRFLAASQRGSVPDDIYEYFFSTSLIYSVIKAAKEAGADEASWAELLSNMEDGNAAAE